MTDGRKDEQCCQTAAVFTLVEFEVKKRFGTCIQSIRVWIWSKEFTSVVNRSYHLNQYLRFWILVKKRNIRFRIENLVLDFTKETHAKIWNKSTLTKTMWFWKSPCKIIGKLVLLLSRYATSFLKHSRCSCEGKHSLKH